MKSLGEIADALAVEIYTHTKTGTNLAFRDGLLFAYAMATGSSLEFSQLLTEACDIGQCILEG